MTTAQTGEVGFLMAKLDLKCHAHNLNTGHFPLQNPGAYGAGMALRKVT